MQRNEKKNERRRNQSDYILYYLIQFHSSSHDNCILSSAIDIINLLVNKITDCENYDSIFNEG